MFFRSWNVISPAGDLVFVEEPTYFLMLKVFAGDFKLRTEGIPMDENGMRVDILEERLVVRMSQTFSCETCEHIRLVSDRNSSTSSRFITIQLDTPSRTIGAKGSWSWCVSACAIYFSLLLSQSEQYNFLIVSDEAYQVRFTIPLLTFSFPFPRYRTAVFHTHTHVSILSCLDILKPGPRCPR